MITTTTITTFKDLRRIIRESLEGYEQLPDVDSALRDLADSFDLLFDPDSAESLYSYQSVLSAVELLAHDSHDAEVLLKMMYAMMSQVNNGGKPTTGKRDYADSTVQRKMLTLLENAYAHAVGSAKPNPQEATENAQAEALGAARAGVNRLTAAGCSVGYYSTPDEVDLQVTIIMGCLDNLLGSISALRALFPRARVGSMAHRAKLLARKAREHVDAVFDYHTARRAAPVLTNNSSHGAFEDPGVKAAESEVIAVSKTLERDISALVNSYLRGREEDDNSEHQL